MTYQNHAYDLAFEVMTKNEEATAEEILEGLLRRVEFLKNNPNELKEACSCYDPTDQEYTQEDYENWKNLK